MYLTILSFFVGKAIMRVLAPGKGYLSCWLTKTQIARASTPVISQEIVVKSLLLVLTHW